MQHLTKGGGGGFVDLSLLNLAPFKNDSMWQLVFKTKLQFA